MTKKDQRRKTSTSRPSREVESTLIICSEKPKAVVRQIGSLTSIANYRLLSKGSETIRDLYFDTRESALQTQKLALRIREIGAMRWITLKGPSQPTGWGGVERFEIEALWSKNALTRVVRELISRGIKMPQRQDFHHAHPLDVMMSLGLEIVHARNTHRQVRNIVFTGEESGPVLAELAIDSVVYHFSNREIFHYEVEVESKVEDGSTALKAVVERLVAMYGSALRRWNHGKLATGKAIEKLLGEGALKGLLDNKNLKPAAYDNIGDCLTRADV